MIDLFIFHLGLQWHSFSDLSTTQVALTADGLLPPVWVVHHDLGLFLLADVRRRAEVPWARWSGAVVAGVGFFRLFDGLIVHKLLRIHQIRYDVDLLHSTTAAEGHAGAQVLGR